MCVMSTQWDRLNSELSKKHKSWASLADHLGLQKQNVGNWKSRGIPAKYLRKCAEFVSRSHDWLDLGEEPQPGGVTPDYKPNTPLARMDTAQAAMNPIALLAALRAQLRTVEERDVVAAMLASLAKDPDNERVAAALLTMLDTAFAQAQKRQA